MHPAGMTAGENSAVQKPMLLAAPLVLAQATARVRFTLSQASRTPASIRDYLITIQILSSSPWGQHPCTVRSGTYLTPMSKDAVFEYIRRSAINSRCDAEENPSRENGFRVPARSGRQARSNCPYLSHCKSRGAGISRQHDRSKSNPPKVPFSLAAFTILLWQTVFLECYLLYDHHASSAVSKGSYYDVSCELYSTDGTI